MDPRPGRSFRSLRLDPPADQIVSFRCSDLRALRGIEDDWFAATEGRHTLLRETVLVDRNDPIHFMTINEVESSEAAMQNSALPETDARTGA